MFFYNTKIKGFFLQSFFHWSVFMTKKMQRALPKNLSEFCWTLRTCHSLSGAERYCHQSDVETEISKSHPSFSSIHFRRTYLF